jgi:hypothetical protein
VFETGTEVDFAALAIVCSLMLLFR